MTTTRRIETTPVEALAVVTLCFGWAIWSSLQAVLQGFPVGHGFTDAGLFHIVGFELVLGTLALTLLWRRGYDVASLVPRVSWAGTAVGLGLALLAGQAEVLATSLAPAGQPEQPIAQMMHVSSISAPALLLMALVNGTFEEVFLLGFLQRGLQAHGLSISLGLMLLVRLSYHLYQGPLGALAVLGYGGVMGLYYARFQRLWPAVLAHIFWDIVPFLLV